jgi:hypothetical protein
VEAVKRQQQGFELGPEAKALEQATAGVGEGVSPAAVLELLGGEGIA